MKPTLKLFQNQHRLNVSRWSGFSAKELLDFTGWGMEGWRRARWKNPFILTLSALGRSIHVRGDVQSNAGRFHQISSHVGGQNGFSKRELLAECSPQGLGQEPFEVDQSLSTCDVENEQV